MIRFIGVGAVIAICGASLLAVAAFFFWIVVMLLIAIFSIF